MARLACISRTTSFGGPLPVQEKYFFPGTGCSDFRPRPVDGAGIEKMVNDFHEIARHLGIELQSASFGVRGGSMVFRPGGMANCTSARSLTDE